MTSKTRKHETTSITPCRLRRELTAESLSKISGGASQSDLDELKADLSVETR